MGHEAANSTVVSEEALVMKRILEFAQGFDAGVVPGYLSWRCGKRFVEEYRERGHECI